MSSSAVITSVDPPVVVDPTALALKEILGAVQKKPTTGSEAVALWSYIMERDIAPLVKKLKLAVIAELKQDEQALAHKEWDAMIKGEEEVQSSWWCCRRH